MKKIDFAIAGFQKCGTTSLHYYLSKQRDIFMPEEKEMYYYSRFFEKKNALEYKESFFKGIREESLVGFSDVDLIMSPHFLKRALKENPEIKVIVMVRDPVDRLKSAYNFEFAKCLEKQKNINAAIRKDITDKKFGYIERSLYGKHLSQAIKVMTSGSLLVLTLEELKENKKETLNKVSEFLGVSLGDVDDQVYNITTQPKSRVLQKILWNPDGLMLALLRVLPRKYKSLIRIHVVNKLIKLNSKKNKVLQSNKVKLDVALATKYFDEDLTILKRDFGIDYRGNAFVPRNVT